VKVVKQAEYALTQLHAKIKKHVCGPLFTRTTSIDHDTQIVTSLDVKEGKKALDIFTLASDLVEGTETTVTVQLCGRLALMVSLLDVVTIAQLMYHCSAAFMQSHPRPARTIGTGLIKSLPKSESCLKATWSRLRSESCSWPSLIVSNIFLQSFLEDTL
jgi:hypothetical protein